MLIFLSIPFTYAEEEEESCGITNLASCIPEKLYDYTIKIINLPLQPLLFLVKKLLADEVNIQVLKSFWSIMVYILSMLYGLLFIFSGINFMASGYDAEKRERAKEWLQNTIIMVFLVQTSFFFYQLLLELTTTLTASVLNMINEHFFLLTADSLLNIGLEIFLVLSYVVVLLMTIIILTVRYLLVAFGVVALPIGIFLYFFPPAKQYGKLIINFIIVATVIPFIDSLILLMGSQILEVGTFHNFKILVMIATFFLVVIVNIMMISFIISKSSGVVPKGSTKLLATAVKFGGL